MSKLVITALSLAACVASTGPGDDDSDPDLDGKADWASPIAKGILGWDHPAEVAFDDAAGAPVSLIYMTFELSGAADVSVETGAGTSDLDPDPDTILYLYRPTGDTWGHYLVKNDDGGAGTFSKLSTQLDAGVYRVLVKRKTGDGTPHTVLTATCAGDGCVPPPHGCTPLEPRTSTPGLFIGPTQWQASIEAAIDSATTSLDVQMYLFTVTDIATHIIDAQASGVAVRVLLDPDEPNGTVKAMLDQAQVPTRFDPPAFQYSHAKYLIIDRATTVIMSGNFNVGATDNERNYAVIDHDLDDVDDVQAIFDTDWVAGPEPDLGCTRLIVSPVNSLERVVDHINTAQHTLDIESYYLDEPTIRAAVADAAATRDVAVRIILSDPAKNPQNTATQSFFNGLGIPTRILLTNLVHAKMIKADGVALVGSENMSTTSMTKNREVGLLLTEPVPVGQIATQFDLDWAAAQ